MSDHRDVKVVGGTFALCFWLFMVFLTLDNIEGLLGRIADALERAYPVIEQVEGE